MNIVKLLEEIANNTHHRVSVESLIHDQPGEIRKAFENKNSSKLRQAISRPSEINANKCMVTLTASD